MINDLTVEDLDFIHKHMTAIKEEFSVFERSLTTNPVAAFRSACVMEDEYHAIISKCAIMTASIGSDVGKIVNGLKDQAYSQMGNDRKKILMDEFALTAKPKTSFLGGLKKMFRKNDGDDTSHHYIFT